jgi:AcrR family transcriptional regulator
MEAYLKIKMNENLFLRNPEETDLGKKIIQHAIILIYEIGFEAFTFKKLAQEIGTTEAGIYRYFENKHLLLTFIVDWYWSWQEYRIALHNKNITNPTQKLIKAIYILSETVVDDISTPYINERLLYDIVMSEGAKAFLTKHVNEYNKAKLFKPYKDLCSSIADLINACNPTYVQAHSLATTILEMSHSLNYYKKNLPSLTDFGELQDDSLVAKFIEQMVFSTIKK